MKNAINDIKNNKNYSKFELVMHMVNFNNIYYKFRPQSITNDDAYFGTVKLIDNIYFTLFSYLGIEPFYHFSKYGDTFIKSNNLSHEEINWDKMLEDTESLINSILLKIEEETFRLLCKLKKNTPWICINIILNLIIKNTKDINMEQIKFDYDNNLIIIDKTNISISTPMDIIIKIRKIKTNTSF